MKKLFFLIVFLAIKLISIAQSRDTFNVYFRLDERTLNNTAVQAIDSYLYNELVFPGQNLIIIGYADYLASNKYNITLSRDRAQNVQAYLLKSGFRKENIILCVGKGKIERPGLTGRDGNAPDRKVQIVINRLEEKKQPPPAKKLPPTTIDTIDQLKPNETLVLDNIYFLPGRHTIREESMPGLEKLLHVLQDHPTLKIQIEGHICCESGGHPDGYDYDGGGYNLSTDRAKAIYDYLTEEGIEPDRLKYKGFGKTRPLVDPERNEDDENRNRRVEIRILEK